MIRRLSIHNFQKHKRKAIRLRRITVIRGTNAAGKSSIIRALKWAMMNTPGGNAFIKKGSPRARVIVDVDGKTIERCKGKQNTYKLGQKVFKAFGSSVPPEIAKHVALGDINFQNQMDGPFWFDKTSGEVARQLNQIINLDVIDSTLGNLASSSRDVRARTEVGYERVKEAEARVKTLLPMAAAHKDLLRVEKLQSEHAAISSRIAQFAPLLKGARVLATRARTSNQAILPMQELILIGDRYAKQRRQTDQLAHLLGRASILTNQINRQAPAIKKLAAIAEVHTTLTTAREELSSLVSQWRVLLSQKHECKAKALSLRKQFKHDLGKECPLCGQSL